MSATAPHHPMTALLATLLAPAFLAATNGDHAAAQGLAREAIASLDPATIPDLLLGAEAIGLSLAAIAALGRAAAPALPENQAYRLRAQADRLSRSASRCQKTLCSATARPRPAHPVNPPVPTQINPQPMRQPAPQPHPVHPPASTHAKPQPMRQPAPQPTSAFSARAEWAAAMQAVADEYAAIPGQPDTPHAAALRGAAEALLRESSDYGL